MALRRLKEQFVGKSAVEEWIELAQTLVVALAIALVLRIFLFQPFNIPSGSMMPNLLTGDFLFVSKYSYGYSKHSFPLSAGPIKGRIFASEPKRGDIAVFKLPTDNRTDYIKRVIGLPGDQIQVKNGVVFINGAPVKREKVQSATSASTGPFSMTQYRETLPNGRSYVTYDTFMTPQDNTGIYRVPAGHYFMMGDNRDNSKDSRFQTEVGYVPRENLVGRAEILFFSFDTENTAIWQIWEWPFAIRYGRILNLI